MIYLDNAASMRMLPNAIKVLEDGLREDFANSSAQHALGKEIAKKIDLCRQQFLNLLKADNLYDVIFTSSASEANNQVIASFDYKAAVSMADHASLAKTVQVKERLELNSDGQIDGGEISSDLIAFSHVNSQSGVVNDLDKLSENLKMTKKHIHVDGVQAFAKIPFSLESGNIDSYTVSSHKIGGPKGIAALFYKKSCNLKPLILGGGQENGLRSSTVAAPLISSFCEATKNFFSQQSELFERIYRFNQHVRNELQEECLFPFALEKSSPYILTFIVPKISSDILMRHLEREEIYVSSKSACSSRVKGKDDVLSTLGIDDKYHKNIIRMSFGFDTSQDEVELACKRMKFWIRELKGLLG